VNLDTDEVALNQLVGTALEHPGLVRMSSRKPPHDLH
jgi:hypothetical protein